MSAPAAAVRWIEGVLLGPVATGLAVVAVAWLGFELIAGRIDWRRGLQMLLGLFVLFGAPTMVRELAGALRGGELSAPDIAVRHGPAVPPPKAPPAADPYAGAAVPAVAEAR
ncbi:MAG: TrbC/VirB2 family protein [Novosphingobium sp.]